MRAVTEEDKDILSLIQADYRIAMVSTEFEGKDATVIAVIGTEGGEDVITPVALIIDTADSLGIFDRLAPPDKDL